jgi:hypothetical protein
MLDLSAAMMRTCDGLNRRSLLKVGTLGGLGVTLPMVLANKARANSAASAANGRDMNCIFIWSHGGASHHDTLDPKPLAAGNVRGPYDVIDTAVPGVQFSEICPNLAKELNRFAVLRSWNPQNGSHSVADQWCMSGRNFNPGTHYPCVGSVVSHQFGFKSALPPFMQVGGDLSRDFGGGLPGVLGLQHGAFEVLSDPNAPSFTVRDITPPGGISFSRVDRRKSMLTMVDRLQRKADSQPKAFDALDEHVKTALSMITAPETKKAFDVGSEDPRLRDRYGRTTVGQRLLLARRLIEAGVRFVTVTSPSWDTHANNFDSLKKNLVPPIDMGLPALLQDLEERGLLDNTLVVWMSDFGRTPKINSASGRDHWATAGFAVMAGAGVPGGSVLGATDGDGERPIKNEYRTDDVMATIYHKIGLPTDLVVQAPDGRPVRLIEGELIREWC